MCGRAADIARPARENVEKMTAFRRTEAGPPPRLQTEDLSMQRTRTLLTPTLLLLLAAGCSSGGGGGGTGGTGDQPSSSGDSSSGPSGSTSGSVGGASGTAATTDGGVTTSTTGGEPEDPPPLQPEVETSCPTVTVSHTPLRRLTRFEYQNSVRDLLNVDVSAVSDMPPDN